MSDLLKKISKAVDVFADTLTENTNSTREVQLYRYDDLKQYVVGKGKEYSSVKKAIISVEKAREFDGIIFSGDRYLIKIVLLDENKSPVYFEGRDDAYIGTIIIASSIDKTLQEFMGGKSEKIVGVK